MEQTNEMVEVLEKFIIDKVNQMKTRDTSPEELEALAELVKAVNQSARTAQSLT